MDRKIKHIIFDLGQVMFAYDPNKIIDNLVPNTKYREFYLNELFGAQLWQDMDRGIISQDDAYNLLKLKINNYEAHVELDTIKDNWVFNLTLIKENEILLKKLAKTYNIYFLTNFQDEPFDAIFEKYDFFKLGKGQIVSAKVKQMKPEPNIYHNLLNTYNLPASECLFIDDLEANINACREIGMHGIIFTSPDQLKSELKNYNI